MNGSENGCVVDERWRRKRERGRKLGGKASYGARKQVLMRQR
jgi:hypothetical protein